MLCSTVTTSPNKLSFFFFNDTATTEIYTLSLHDALPISLSITGIVISGLNHGDFAQTNDCGTTVAVGASCTFSVTFTPTAIGNRSAAVSITDNATGSPQQVSLAGTGFGPMVTLNPTSLSFGNLNVRKTSGAKGI